MPRLTREQRRQLEETGQAPKRRRPPVKKVRVHPPTGQYRQVLCPVCGRAHGSRAFWERTKDFDPNKPFGVVQEVGRGRGASFAQIGFFEPSEDTEGIFDLVKARLLQAVKEWLDKGWIKPSEVKKIIG